MAWKLKLHSEQPTLPQIGDVWPCRKALSPEHSRYYSEKVLSARYFVEWRSHRPPLYVLLPDGTEFCLDGRAACDGTGWTVRGMPHNMNVSPSIHIRGSYHGFIRNGILTDDCDGRKFLKESDNSIEVLK